jgi:parallel beta-helix repeat protein
MKRAIVSVIAMLSFGSLPASGNIIDIPDDYETIQEGIDASADGDTVLVHPGTYVENINFNGHNIVLGSLFLTTGDTSYIEQTIIDGNDSNSVVTFNSGEDRTAVITGFTVQNGHGYGSGGGVKIIGEARPIILGNIIRWNHAWGSEGGGGSGGGIYCSGSNAIIINNSIYGNQTCDGAGIFCNYSEALIVGNIISQNEALGGSEGGGGNGGGIGSHGSIAIIKNNIITNNSGWALFRGGRGGGISSDGGGVIENNTIIGNHAISGGGISAGNATVIVNTIIWENTASDSPQISGNPAVSYCDIQDTLWPGEGNLSIAPLFVDQYNGDFHLQDSIDCGDSSYSPCIDAGHPRILDNLMDCSWGLGTELSDMGAFGGGISFPAVINVPDDYPSIQEGIIASMPHDTVLVWPHTYFENINFLGRNIVLGSLFLTTGDTSYISSTIIDGDSSSSVVTFENGENSDAIISGFSIINGFAENGGGIYCHHSGPRIVKNIISDNSASLQGGGIYCDYANPTIRNNEIINNSAYVGGGIDCHNSDATISNNIISDNFATSQGAGVKCEGYPPIIPDPSITNNVINSNISGYRGGGIYIYNCNSVIENNTITLNSADSLGGGIYINGSDPIITNTTFWGDIAPIGFEIYIQNGSPFFTYSNIQGGWEGEGNIDVDPLFRDPENGDFRLMSTACGDPYDSPCIDAGNPAIIDSLLDCSWGLGTILSDMGAYGGGDSVQVSIEDRDAEVPRQFALAQNYPNPFNTITIIQYSLPGATHIVIDIYDLLGRKVETLVQGEQTAGHHQIVWDAGGCSSGMYFYRIQAGENTEIRKMLLIK